MIVKDEEKNIEKALAWAKDIAFEQIVVDTGSTDRTVELAKKMGATVFHFDWINDFGAAKNFAMDKAKGNWIAILDADEYMPAEDALETMNILENIQSDPTTLKQYDGIRNSWVQLDDFDNITTIKTVIRIFRNSPELRYKGKIHETVLIQNSKIYEAANLRIMHTGYAPSATKETGKRERNINMLRNELKHDPDNPNIMIYLADSIKGDGALESRIEAENLYLKALSGKRKADTPVKQLAYDFLIPRFSGDIRYKNGEPDTDLALKFCNEAIAELPGHIDYNYYRAIINNKIGNFKEAQDDLQVCEKAFLSETSLPNTRLLYPSPMPLYFQHKIAAKGLGDEEGFKRSSTILNSMLVESKNDSGIIGSFMKSLLVYGMPEEEALAELSEVYDLSDPKELLFIARAAKDTGAIEFARVIMSTAQELMSGR